MRLLITAETMSRLIDRQKRMQHFTLKVSVNLEAKMVKNVKHSLITASQMRQFAAVL